jgi:predicted nucleotidyltransferase
MTEFSNILRALIDGRVEFILVGGAAAIVHGSARLTQDVDVVYARHDENIAALVQAIAPLNPYLRGAPPNLPFRWDEQTIRQGLNFTLTTDMGELDLLGEITGGGGYDNLLPHSIMIQAFGAEFRCLDLDWLIRVKRAAGRPKDFEAISELEAIYEQRCD